MSIQSSVESVLDNYGTKLDLTHDEITLDTNGDEASRVTKTYSVNAVLSNYNRKLVNGESILEGDVRAYIAPFTIDPSPGDSMKDSAGRMNKIINVRRFEVSGDKVLWELQLRH